MHKWDPVERGHGEQANLENRLAAYYGPELQEQPLPEASWLRLKTRLEQQRSYKRQRLCQWYKQSHLQPRSMRRHIHSTSNTARMFCIAMLGLLQIQGRRSAFKADVLVVQWLGRSRACQGLHALANRDRSRRRSRWGEPSLAERIDRVCGTQVTSEANRLTLVR